MVAPAAQETHDDQLVIKVVTAEGMLPFQRHQLDYLYVGYMWNISPGILSCFLLAPKCLGLNWLTKGKNGGVLPFHKPMASKCYFSLEAYFQISRISVTQRRTELPGSDWAEGQGSAWLLPHHFPWGPLGYLWVSWHLIWNVREVLAGALLPVHCLPAKHWRKVLRASRREK